MSRPLAILFGAAACAIIALVAFFFAGEIGRRADQAASARLNAAAAANADCARAERELVAAKAGRPVAGAEPESVLRILVWGCRGWPSDRLPADM